MKIIVKNGSIILSSENELDRLVLKLLVSGYKIKLTEPVANTYTQGEIQIESCGKPND